MAPGSDPAVSGRHLLGPHVVGQRVVIRRVLRGETGPTGGPAMTDVLGICESWAGGEAVVRREDGTAVRIATADIVSGKPVPPRPSRFSRLSAEEVEQRAAGIFRPREVRRLGGWLLRWTGGSNRRPNSVLPLGDPGVTLDEALTTIEEFYANHGMRPCAQVVVGSDVQHALEDRGWTRLDPDESDTDVLVAGVAALSRQLRRYDMEIGDSDVTTGQLRHYDHPTGPLDVHLADHVSREWLVGNERALANYDAVEAALRLEDAAFVSVEDEGRQVARGRVNLVGDWALFADLTVQPDRRREGLAHVVMAEVTSWAGERGASAMLLQVQADNEPAQRLYGSLGFERHHGYRYLVPPDLDE